jgi:hypothetical protein
MIGDYRCCGFVRLFCSSQGGTHAWNHVSYRRFKGYLSEGLEAAKGAASLPFHSRWLRGRDLHLQVAEAPWLMRL